MTTDADTFFIDHRKNKAGDIIDCMLYAERVHGDIELRLVHANRTDIAIYLDDEKQAKLASFLDPKMHAELERLRKIEKAAINWFNVRIHDSCTVGVMADTARLLKIAVRDNLPKAGTTPAQENDREPT